MRIQRTYPSVVAFKLESQSDVLRGYAAPMAGPEPCVVALVAGLTTIAMVRAGQFSKAALAAGKRDGWCGFELPGVAKALAFDAPVELRCMSTQKALCSISYRADVFDLKHASENPLSPAEVRAAATRALSCPDVALLLPFADAFMRLRGRTSLIHTTYQSFLGRQPSGLEVEAALEKLSEQDGLEAFLVDRWASRGQGPTQSEVPGPFHPAFPYDRAFLK